MPAVPPDLAERFGADLEALGVGPDLGLALAVSGGPDSLALLLLAHAAHPGPLHAATVDHGLRPEAAGEAAFVAEVCAGLGVPHRTLRAHVRTAGEGLQAAARDARYAALRQWLGLSFAGQLVTAHHADDQAETLLLRLGRGAGIGGLAGIRPRGWVAGGAVYRPLLGWRKAELEAVVAAAGIAPRDDPSNRDDRFDRTRARRLLADTPWLEPQRLAAAAAHLRQADEALDWAARQEWRTRVTGRDDLLRELDPSGLPAELLRRLVLDVMDDLSEQMNGAESSVFCTGPELTRLIERLKQGRTSTLSGIKATPGDRWRFEPAPPRRDARA